MNLKCQSCLNKYNPITILENSKLGTLEIPTIFFVCPDCGHNNIIFISKDKMSLIDVISMSDWRELESIVVKGLDYREDPEILHCWLDYKHFEFQK